MSCEKFIGQLFLSRDVTHSVHLNTRSYAKHKALAKFYNEIINLADKFAEAYQGKYGLIGPIELQSAKKTNNVVEFLEDMAQTIMDERYDVVEKECTPLQNIIDEILALFPDLAANGDSFAGARLSLKAHEARVLLAG